MPKVDVNKPLEKSESISFKEANELNNNEVNYKHSTAMQNMKYVKIINLFKN